MQTNDSTKNGIHTIMLTTDFSRRVVTNFSFHFSKLDIYFCPFFFSDAISFLDFYKIFSVELFNLAIKDPIVGRFLNIPPISEYPTHFCISIKRVFSWGFFVRLLSRFSMSLKIMSVM